MRHLAILLALVACLSPAPGLAAADQVVPVPEGWTLDLGDYPHAASPNGLAVVLYKFHSGDPTNLYESSRVLQVVGSNQYHTDFPGKVVRVEYSATGNHLLAVQLSNETPTASTLMTNQGEIVWSKSDSRFFSFSTTGEVVYAWRSGRSNIEVFNLAGNSLHSFDVGMPLPGVVVLGSGQQAILIKGQSIVCLDATSLGVTWRVDLPKEYPEFISLRAIDPNRVVVRMYRGVSAIIGTNGTLEHTYDPQALGLNDPVKEPADYARYGFFAGPTAGTLTLFDRTSVTYTLDLASGQLTPRKVNATPPADSKLGPSVLHQRLFFFSAEQIVIRQI